MNGAAIEFVDILNDRGDPTGRVVSKSEIHQKGYWHKAVHVWILNSKNELLIQKRASAKETYPNMWDIPSAGHAAAGETPTEAAIRETKEELDLKTRAQDFEYLFTVSQQVVLNNGAYINNEFNDVYLLQHDLSLSNLNLQKSEVSEVKFFHFLELRKIIEQNRGDFVPHPAEYQKLFEILGERLL